MIFSKKNEKQVFNLNESFKFNNELELNIYVRKLMANGVEKDIRLEIAIESLLRSLIYYVYSCKSEGKQTLNQVIEEIEMSVNTEENEDGFINKIDTFPIDHPARIYWKEVSSLSKEELKEIFKKSKNIIKASV